MIPLKDVTKRVVNSKPKSSVTTIRKQQDDEYARSLAIDQAKSAKKAAEKDEQERERKYRLEQWDELRNLNLKIAQPSPFGKHLEIQVCLPTGKRIRNKFQHNTRIRDVLYWSMSQFAASFSQDAVLQGDYDQHFQVWKSNKYVLATAFPPMTLYTNIEESLYNAEIEHRSVLRLQEVFETPKKPEKRSKPSVIPKSSKSLSKKPSVQKISHGSSVSSASQQESSSDSDCVPDENEFKISMDPDILNIIGSIQNQLSFCIESEDDSTSSMESGSDSSPVVSNQSRSNSNSYRQPSVPKSTSITDALTAEDSVEEICSDDSGEYPITPIHSNKGKPKPIGFFDAKKISISIDQSDSNEEEISYEGKAGNERESEAEGGVDIIESEEESEEDSVSKDSFVVDDDDEVLQSSSDSDSAPKTKSTKKKPSMFEESIEDESSTSSASLEEDYISLDSPSPPKKVGKKSTVTKKRKSTIIYKDDSVEIQVFDDSPMIKKNKSTANDSSSEEEEEHSADSEDDESPKRPIVVEPITNATPLKRVSIFKMATPRRSVVRPNNVEIIDLDDSPPKKKQSKQSNSAESDYSDRTSVSQEYDSESVETSESPKFSLYSPVKESYIPTPPKAASKKQFKPKIPAKQFERNHVIALDDDESVQLVDSEPVNPRGKVANNSIKEKEKEKENDTPMTLNNQLATKKPFGMDHNLDHFKESVCGADGVIRNLNVPLLKHQIMGVNWMIQREKSVFDRASVARCAGGILADDMGLGKTIQTIATVLKNPSPHKWKSTLIVCTLSTVSQWEKEILTKTYPDNYLKVSLYYGNKRESDPTVLAASDIVLTTYGVLQSEFSKGKPEHMTLIDPDMININDLPKPKGRSGKAKVKSTAALFQVKWWRVVLDEGHVIKNRQTGKHKAAVRLEAYNRWCLTGTPIQNELKDIWSLLHFIRAPDCENLRVFNSYVADIKNMNSESALKKLQQLIEPLLLRREKSILKEDKESSFSDLPPCKIEFVYLDFTEDENIFYQKLWDAATQDFEQLRAKGLVIKNYMHIFEQILRLRQACNHIYLLMKDSSLLCDINGRDNSAATLCRINIQANLAMKELRKAIKDKPAAPVPSGDFRLTPFSNLRAIEMDNVDTCTICVSEADNPVITPCHHIFCLDCITDWFNESSKDTLYFECPNCRNRVASHLLKSVVIKKKKKRRSTWADTRIQKSLTSACPPASSSSKYNLQGLPDDILVKIFSYCQQDIKTIFALNLVCSKFYAITTTLFSKLHHSTKTIKLIQHIQRLDDKCVVFSQFTRFLDVVELGLTQADIKFVRLDGSLSLAERKKAVDAFQNDTSVRVFILSLKAAACGLNLTASKYVFMLDPWWNGAIEQQAIDRVHRYGQTKQVTVFRYVMRGSIEENLLLIQERKLKMSSAVLSEPNASKLSVDDLVTLFTRITAMGDRSK